MFGYTRIFQVNDHLFISGEIKPKDMNRLVGMGISVIINLMLEVTYGKSVPESIQLVHIPVRDGERIPKKVIRQIYEVIDHFKTDHKMLIHCAAGVSRSAGIIIGQLMREKSEWNWNDAEKYLRSIKPVIPDIFIRESLEDYLRQKTN